MFEKEKREARILILKRLLEDTGIISVEYKAMLEEYLNRELALLSELQIGEWKRVS